jgi:uncharacterized protein YutE (UPF0331/DUF86 family)
MIDLCTHVISKNGFRTPDDYSDAFRVIGEQGVFDAEFVQTFSKMALFRNRLDHIYWEVDENELHRILHTGLPDVVRFLKAFGSFLNE